MARAGGDEFIVVLSGQPGAPLAEAGRRSLLALEEFGFSLAMDDFGTGYSCRNRTCVRVTPARRESGDEPLGR